MTNKALLERILAKPYSFVEDLIMLYKEFIEDVRKALFERMDNITVIEDDILKNNGLHYPSLLVKEEGEKLGFYKIGES